MLIAVIDGARLAGVVGVDVDGAVGVVGEEDDLPPQADTRTTEMMPAQTMILRIREPPGRRIRSGTGQGWSQKQAQSAECGVRGAECAVHPHFCGE
jgi:hypothetical protein